MNFTLQLSLLMRSTFSGGIVFGSFLALTVKIESSLGGYGLVPQTLWASTANLYCFFGFKFLIVYVWSLATFV